MVEIIDSSERLRRESYHHINEILQPDFHLQTAGTGAHIYRGRAPMLFNELVGQWDKHDGYPVGDMFLYWDNVQITIRGSPELFMGVARRLEEHSFRVKIEV